MPVVQHPDDALATAMAQWASALQHALIAPPEDVRAMLARHGCGLPHYLDVQRLRQLAHARQRWPALWLQSDASLEVA